VTTQPPPDRTSLRDPDAAPAEPCVCAMFALERCGNEHSDGSECTRLLHHDGDHVACGTTKHRLATWPQVQR